MFNTVFKVISVISPWPVHLSEVLLTSTQHIILTNPLAALPHYHCRNSERGMNPVALTIIEYWPSLGSNQLPPEGVYDEKIPIILYTNRNRHT